MKGCWKKAYFRGLGAMPSECAAEDMTRSGIWCFQNCREGYTGYSRSCYKDCPPESKSSFLGSCSRAKSYKRGPGSTQECPGCTKIGLKYYEDCKKGFTASGSNCKADCPEGTTDAGWQGCKKTTYRRQSGQAKCKADE